MTTTNGAVVPERYGRFIIWIHWLMLALIAGVYVCMEAHEFFPKGSGARAGFLNAHYLLGLLVFHLTILRVVVRYSGRLAPPIVPVPPRWQALSATGLHLLLYAFMLAMPMIGWVLLSAKGGEVSVFGSALPSLAGQNKALAHTLAEVHETIGNVGYFLIGLHAAAALYHHYIVHDNTLVRMLPRRD